MRTRKNAPARPWRSDEAPTLVIPLAPPPGGTKVLALRLRSARATMLVVDLRLIGRGGGSVAADAVARPRGGAAATGMKTSFVVEWEGVQDLHFLLSGFGPDDRPGPLAEVTGL